MTKNHGNSYFDVINFNYFIISESLWDTNMIILLIIHISHKYKSDKIL